MTTRDASDAQEKRVAKRHKVQGGKTVGGSGCGSWAKGDVLLRDVFLECKTKMSLSKSITVMREWLEKAKTQAFGMRKKDYAVVIGFGDGKDYYIIDEQFFSDLLESREELKKLRGEG